MGHSTTKTYTMKQSILKFGKRIFGKKDRPEQKFGADMAYGMLASGSCLLTSIVDELHEVSLFSRIHSSAEKDYVSANTVTFEAIEQSVNFKLFAVVREMTVPFHIVRLVFAALPPSCLSMSEIIIHPFRRN